jgi:acetyl-CoA carboxylase biotin carboxyl carrier protein
MELEDIRSLIGVAERLGLAELVACKAGVTLRLLREGRVDDLRQTLSPLHVPVPVPMPVPVRGDLVAPLAGVLHLTPAPGAPPFVMQGQAIRRGETLCLIEAMKVFSRIGAEQDGVIEAVLVTSGAEIEAGQTLMRIGPTETAP